MVFAAQLKSGSGIAMGRHSFGTSFGGANLFRPKSTKAQILNKLGRTAEADAIMKAAMPLANMNELHAYGRSLLQQKKNKEAVDIFKTNFQKHLTSLQP